MMNWILRNMRKKLRGKKGWGTALAASALFTFIAASSTGASIQDPTTDGVIGGRAWCDVNEDGKRQKGEPLLPDAGVTLQQLEHDGKLTDVATTITNVKGRYKFKDLSLGTYVVVFEHKGLAFTTANIGNDKRDSDVTEILSGAGSTNYITLDAHDPTNYSTDAGYVGCDTPDPPKDGAIGGVTWCDENRDGKRQANEVILPGVCAKLKKVVNGQYEVVAETTTDADGRYKFKELPMGTYVVAWCDNNLAFTVEDEGDDCKDSDVIEQSGNLGLSAQIVLNADHPSSLCTDAGYVGDCGPPPPPEATCEVVTSTGTTFDFAYENVAPGSTVVRNGEAIDTISGTGTFSDNPGGPDGTSYEYAIESDGQTAAVCGEVTVVNPPQPNDGVIGGKAWCDLKEDGKRQDTDTLLPDVAVTLKKKLPDGVFEVVDTTTTDADGRYQFTDLPLGTYVVAFDDNGFGFTAPDAAGDCMDSDVVEHYDATEFTAPIVLDANEPTSTCTDAGYVGCGPTAPCIETIHHDVPLIYDKYRKFMRTGVWIKWEQLEALGVDLPHQYDRADDDFSNSMSVIEGDFTELRQELTNLGAKWVRLVAEGSWSWLQLRIDAPTSSDDWRTDMFNPEYVSQLPPTLKFTIKIVYNGKEQEVCLDVPYYFTHQRISSPIALDTDGSGAVERIPGEFAFDFAANGEPVKAGEWFAPTEGILVDTRIPGPMTGAHLFGDMGGHYADGYAKLATLDANADGAVSGTELAGLAIWTDANSNAMADAGEISSLAAHRIVSLSTSHTGYVSTVTLADGTTMIAEDLWFPVVPPPAAPVVTPVVSIKMLAFGLGGAILLMLLIVATRRSRQGSVPEVA